LELSQTCTEDVTNIHNPTIPAFLSLLGLHTSLTNKKQISTSKKNWTSLTNKTEIGTFQKELDISDQQNRDWHFQNPGRK
jgi:hypothetical protein